MSDEPLRRFGRRTDLLEQAAEASRAGIRSRRERLIATGRPILQSSVAAALAWLVATEVIGHERPFFAPIAALVTLGLTVGERRRRAVEIAIGVAVGIAVADALVALIGAGTWQVAVVTGLAMLGATLVGGGPLLASQAGVSAAFVATLQPPEGGWDFNRFVDALAGAGVALVVGSLLLPVHPLRLVGERTAPLLDRLAATLGEIARALVSRDAAAADAAVAAVGEVDARHDAMTDALDAAGEAARLRPGRRGALRELERYAVAAGELGLAVENVRGLARGVTRAISLDDAVPPEAVDAISALAESARALGGYLEGGDGEPARSAATRAAALANAVLDETSNLSALNIVGQVRMTAVDLLRAAGLDRGDAQRAVRSAALESPAK
ncbi:MAG: FUSC family protein [Thermoleophilaceae bacterium]|nr:FUSC family protein [Thermoleophilaceae bacterium]